jgi:hypothetical protein
MGSSSSPEEKKAKITQKSKIVKLYELASSKLNKTPPIGAPKATDTPAAAAADNISLFLASFLPYFGKRYERMLPTKNKN